MVVNRRHLEYALVEGPEPEDLDQHRQRLDHEDPADQDQQHGRVRHDRQRRDRAAQPKRAGVTHEDARGERVEPQECDARTGEAASRELEIMLATRAHRRDRGVMKVIPM